MKSFFILSIAGAFLLPLSYAAADADKAGGKEMHAQHEKCLKDHNVTDEQLAAMKGCWEKGHDHHDNKKKMTKEEWKKEMESHKTKFMDCLKTSLNDKFDDNMKKAMDECHPHHHGAEHHESK